MWSLGRASEAHHMLYMLLSQRLVPLKVVPLLISIIGGEMFSDEEENELTPWYEQTQVENCASWIWLLGIVIVTDKSASAWNTVVAYTREYFKVSYPLRNLCTLSKV
jgi:hypothetical protein